MRPIDRADDYVYNVIELCDALPYLAPLKVIMEVWRLANIQTLQSIVITQSVKNDMLKSGTVFVVGIGSDLNCYPLGYNTGLLYDIDGNPIT